MSKQPVHTITLECGHTATLANNFNANKNGIPETVISCTARVNKVLPCGHTALVACSTSPAAVKCAVMVWKESSLCGHFLETKCSTDVREMPCTQPCFQPLPHCEHPCSGTCVECRNGRLHLRCRQRCTRVLVCGHKCDSTYCHKVCPPCERPCETVCGHGRCGYAHRDEQNEEEEKELWGVEGEEKSIGSSSMDTDSPSILESGGPLFPGWFFAPQISLSQSLQASGLLHCWEPCDVEPCQQPCLKPLACNPSQSLLEVEEQHLCIGMCGEPCPKLCAICNPAEFAELKSVFLGYEDEEGARFVQLPDCGHIIEAKGLDMHIRAQMGILQAPRHQATSVTMANGGHGEQAGTSAAATNAARLNSNSSSHAIVTISCPKCTMPIRQSQRYISAINERAADIEAIKRKLLDGFSMQELRNQWRILKRRFASHTDGLLNAAELTPFLCHLVDLISVFNPAVEQKHHLNMAWLNAAEDVVNICGKLIQRNKELTRWGLHHDLRGAAGQLSQARQPNLMRVLQEWMPAMLATASFSFSASLLHQLIEPQLSISNDEWQPRFGDYLQGELVEILGRLIGNNSGEEGTRLLPSDAELQQLGGELARYDLMVNLIRYLCRLIAMGKEDIDEIGEAFLASILKALNGPMQFTGEYADSVASTLKQLADHHKVDYELSKGEKFEIVSALKSRENVTAWYKCSNGHLYGVGNCGNPQQQTECPECGEAIGGTDETLALDLPLYFPHLMGDSAKNQLTNEHENTIFNVKHLIGREYTDKVVQNDLKLVQKLLAWIIEQMWKERCKCAHFLRAKILIILTVFFQTMRHLAHVLCQRAIIEAIEEKVCHTPKH